MENPATTATAPATATATPAAATAATSSTPVTPGAPTSVTQTDGAQGQGALSSADSIAAMVSAAESKGFGKAETETPTTPASTETPAAASGESASETPAASETETPAGDEGEETPSFSLDTDGFVGAKDLAAKIDANPALKAALPEDVRNEIMANARLAERGSQYEEFFASPAEARIVNDTAQQHAAFAEAFNSIQDDVSKGTTAFVQKLIEASVLRDADGNPLKDEKGYYRTDGTANKFVDTVGRRWLNLNIAEKVKAIQDPDVRENVQAALDLVMESVGLLPSTADKTNQDPALAAREAELKRQQDALNTERANDQKQRRQEYTAGLNKELETLYDTEVGNLMKAATGLDKLRQNAIGTELEKAISAAIKRNISYQTRKSRLQSEPMSPARQKKEVALAKEFFADNLARIAKPIFEEAGISLKKGAQARAEAQAAREDNSRSEVKGGRAVTPNPAVAGAPGSYTEQRAQAVSQWKAANPGKEPSDSDINIWMMMQSVKAKGLVAA
ncbi:MAG: hypothetical protein KGL39_37385 [Patescibacteria group bacterium]|nr:hypothetical protein [Patescibacteria group bacterium]